MDIVAAYAAKHPHRPALVEGERSLTWEQFFRTRNRLAHALAALGIGAGQHAIVYAHNALENLVVGAALRALGAIGVPMNHRLTAEEVAYILDNADATAVFVGDAFLAMAERVGGAALYAQMVGGTVVVMRKFDPEETLRLVERHRCTTTFMAPTLLKRIVDLPAEVRARYDVSSMRSLVIAAAPCPMRVKEQALALFGPVLYEFYGSTELGVNTVLRPEDVLRKPGSCGRAAPGVELTVLGDDGRPAPTGTPGELFVRRYDGVFDEYYPNPAATAQTSRGEWMSVGAVAWMEDEGFVYICDRKRDMIISGGVNIYPAEIEDALHRHPAVEDAAVFGVPDPEWGERVHAAVQLRAGHHATETELMEFCRAHIADYKTPREVSFHADFPRDTAGKLVKRLLREPYWAGRTTRV